MNANAITIRLMPKHQPRILARPSASAWTSGQQATLANAVQCAARVVIDSGLAAGSRA
jgi:hypothetical protein